MIPREKQFLAICTLILIATVKAQGERFYDTSEWIPITPKSLEASGSEIVEEKLASDRVLRLDSPAQQKFFPENEFDYRKRRPNQVQQFIAPVKKGFEQPRPRKLKHPLEYKFETPPPPPSKNQPQINYYNGENLSPNLPYLFDSPQYSSNPQQNYYNQENRPAAAVPNINTEAPSPNAPTYYEQYQQLPFNATFYQSLDPTLINNDFYQAINNNNSQLLQHSNLNPTKSTVEKETVQLVYVPVENLKPNLTPNTQNSKQIYQQPNLAPSIDNFKQTYQSNYQQPNQPSSIDSPKQTYQSNYQQPNQPPTIDNSKQTYQQPNQVQNTENSKQFYQQTVTPASQQNSLRQQYEATPTKSFADYPKQTSIWSQPSVDSPRQEKLIFSSDNKRGKLERIEQDFIQQALQAQKLQEQFNDEINPIKQHEIFTTTAKSKQKPHQPPLSLFLNSQKKAEVSDVLSILRDAKTISVQDTITPNSPRVFIGPSNLNSPEGYHKFPLPYLNNINGNRIERKIEQLPFFVAPVSYKTPPGYSKISLPSPHVGSVVVSLPVTSTTPEPLFNQVQFGPFGYTPIQSPRTPRPLENIDTYSLLDNRNQYQSSTTQSSLILPVKNSFEEAFPQNEYYQNSNPQIEEQIYSSSRGESENTSPSPSRAQQTKLPDINPLELAINEFELHQINDQAEKHNKVKHSTTRRPQVSYENTQSVSTRSPQTRGRYNYENDATTERTRGRVRGRGRGSAATRTTTTTSAPSETDRYTVLEEFVARNPSTDNYRNPSTESYRNPSTENYRNPSTESYRNPSTESYRNPSTENYRNPSTESYRNPSTETYRSPSVEVETESSRRLSTTPFSGNPYLPDSQTQSNNRQIYDDSRDIQFETPKSPNVDIEFEEPKRQPQTLGQSNKYYQSENIENVPANVYNLGQPQTYENGRLVYENIEPNNEIKTVAPTTNKNNNKVEEVVPTHLHRFSPEVISYENREPNQQRRPQERPNTYQQYESENINSQRPTYQQEYEVEINEPEVKQVVQTEIYQRPRENVEEEEVQEDIRKKTPPDPASFLDNLNRPNFDQTYISLQDQAVRSLLVPNLLAPSKTEANNVKEIIISSTEPIIEHSTEAETTTTTRASRTRGRSRARLSTTESSVATNTRRASSRRRPITSTERYSSREDAGSSDSNMKQQRFRTRGRPIQNEIADRVSTTENEIRAFKESLPKTDFEPIKSQEPPQSYMQFEHAIEDQQIITLNPAQEDVKEYHQVYELPQQNQQPTQQVLEYENTKTRPIVDVQVTHITPEEEQKLEITTKAPEEETYSRQTNANIKSGGVLNNNRVEQTTRASSTRTRSRTRNRSRFALSTTTTIRPVTRISTRYTTAASKSRETTPKEEQEFYGFTRQPAYTPANLNIQSEPQIKFVGEIRPKYSPRTTTLSSAEVDSGAETARPRIRSRTRAPARKISSTYRQPDNDVYNGRSTEQVTRRSSVATTKTRTRGSSHYRAPENLKRESEDEDVANQNYPVNFLQKLDASSPKPIQINVDNEETDDQSPYSSIYRPRFVTKPNDWNSLPNNDKPEESESLAFIQSTTSQLPNEFTESEVDKIMNDLEKIQTLPTENSVTTVEPTEPVTKSRRRGIWKLVKHRPLDPLEVSESQNYQTVLNAFDSIEKVDAYSKSTVNEEKSKAVTTTESVNNEAVSETEKEETIFTTQQPPTTKTQENIFDTIYEMFGIFQNTEKNENVTLNNNNNNLNVPVTTTFNPTFPDEITDEVPTTIETIITETTTEKLATELINAETTTIKPSTMPYEVEPWEMRAVKTSTSTEISHETEICYKGRCVKSRERKKH